MPGTDDKVRMRLQRGACTTTLVVSMVALISQRERDLALDLPASDTNKPNRQGPFPC